jgi:hypothetical protein
MLPILTFSLNTYLCDSHPTMAAAVMYTVLASSRYSISASYYSIAASND